MRFHNEYRIHVWGRITGQSKGCSQENLVSTGGAGLFYCFAEK